MPEVNSSLVAAAELWQACDCCLRYQMLSRCLTGRPLYASNRELAGCSVPDNLNGSFRKLRTGGDDPERSFTNAKVSREAVKPSAGAKG